MNIQAGFSSVALSIPPLQEFRLGDDQLYRPRLLGGASGIDLEVDAAQRAMRALGVGPDTIDFVLSTSFPTDKTRIGNGVVVAERLWIQTPAVNLESACAGGLWGIITACAYVSSGIFKRVLVTGSCPYSHTVHDGHPANSVVGDAAFATIIEPVTTGGLVAVEGVHSGPTKGCVSWGEGARTELGINLVAGTNTAGILQGWALGELPEVFEKLLIKARVEREGIAHVVANAPTLSFVDHLMTAIEMPREKAVNTNRMLGNVGPALIGVSLFYSALMSQFFPGDRVLFCSVGSHSSLVMALMEWPGSVVLGSVPPYASTEMLRRLGH